MNYIKVLYQSGKLQHTQTIKPSILDARALYINNKSKNVMLLVLIFEFTCHTLPTT